MTKKKKITCADILIACVVILFFIGYSIDSDKSNIDTATQQTSSSQSIDSLNNQEIIKKLDGYVKEFQKAGIFKKVTDFGSDGERKMIEIQADEYLWNNLDYETKIAVENMLLKYWEIGHATILLKGYRTGQKLNKRTKNFEI